MLRLRCGTERVTSLGVGGAYVGQQLREFIKEWAQNIPPVTNDAHEEVDAELNMARSISWNVITVREGYGISETGHVATGDGYMRGSLQYRLRPVPSLGITQRDVEEQNKGELLVKVPFQVNRYLGTVGVEQTKERFTEDAILKTGHGEFLSASLVEETVLQHIPTLVQNCFVTLPSLELASRMVNSVALVVVLSDSFVQKLCADLGVEYTNCYERAVASLSQRVLRDAETTVRTAVSDLVALGHLRRFEVPFGVITSTTTFTVANHLLTPSIKPARATLEKRFRAEVDRRAVRAIEQEQVGARTALNGAGMWSLEFERLGGDSMAAVALSAQLQAIGVSMSPGEVLRCRGRICTDENRSNNSSSNNNDNNSSSVTDINIDDLVRGVNEGVATADLSDCDDGHVVITGCTGFVGRNVLRHFLLTERPVVCLVRGDIQASQQRVQQRLPDVEVGKAVWLQVPSLSARTSRDVVDTAKTIVDVIGNSTVQRVVAVVHSACEVNHVKQLREIWPVNVGGTAVAARFARLLGCRRFVHVSSQSASRPSNQVGYGASKLLSEQVLLQCSLDMQLHIVRLGMVGWNSETGDVNERDWFNRALLACVRLRTLPPYAANGSTDGDFYMSLVPVDTVARHFGAMCEYTTDTNTSVFRWAPGYTHVPLPRLCLALRQAASEETLEIAESPAAFRRICRANRGADGVFAQRLLQRDLITSFIPNNVVEEDDALPASSFTSTTSMQRALLSLLAFA
ncbi:MAG: hypothetical protein MHM6MM_001849 [Cercozoa sp. M6MM]